MKFIHNFSFFLIITLTCLSCNNESSSAKNPPAANADNTKASKTTDLPAVDSIGLTYFRDLMGKYPSEIKLFEKPELAARLQKMMGEDFDFLEKNWQTEVPIEISNGIAFTWGMQAHSGGDPGSALCADISKNVLSAAIRKDGKVKTYSENNSALPEQLLDWVKGE